MDEEDFIVAPLEGEPETHTASDAVDALQSGAYGVAASIAGMANAAQRGDRQSTMGQISAGMQDNAQAQLGEMSDQGRDYGANFLPTEGKPDIWDDDVSVLRAIGLKVAGTTPSLAASIVPGMVISKVIGAGALGAEAINLASAGAQSGGDVWNQIEQGIYDAKDADLQANSEPYREWRDSGDSEEEAKGKLVRSAAGAKPLLMAAITGLTSKYMGIEGRLANEAGDVAAKRLIAGGSGEAAQEGIEGLSGQGLTQSGKMEAGVQKGFDWQAAWEDALQGAAMGFATGGATNLAIGARPKQAGVETVEGVSADENAALDTSSQQDEAKTAEGGAGETAAMGAEGGSVPTPSTVAGATTSTQAPINTSEEVVDEEDTVPEDTEGMEEVPASMQDKIDASLAEVNTSITADADQIAALQAGATNDVRAQTPTPPAAGVPAGPVPGPGGGDSGSVGGGDPVGAVDGPAVADPSAQPSYDDGLFGRLPEQQAPQREVAPEPVTDAGNPDQGELNWDVAPLPEDDPTAGFSQQTIMEPGAQGAPVRAEVVTPSKSERAKIVSRGRSSVAPEVAAQAEATINQKAGVGQPKVLPGKNAAPAQNRAPQVRVAGEAAAFVQDTDNAFVAVARKRVTEQGNNAPEWARLAVAAADDIKGMGRGGHNKHPERYKNAKAILKEAKATALQEHLDQEAAKPAPEPEADEPVAAQKVKSKSKEREAAASAAKAKAQDEGARGVVRGEPAPADDKGIAALLSGTAQSAKDTAQRLGRIVAAAKKAGIEIPARATKHTTPYLRALMQYRDFYNDIQAGKFGATKRSNLVMLDRAVQDDALLDEYFKTIQIDNNSRGDEGAAQNNRGEQEGTSRADKEAAVNDDTADRMAEEAFEAKKRREQGEAATGEATEADDRYAKLAEEKGVKAPTSEERKAELDRKIERVEKLAASTPFEGERRVAQARAEALKNKREGVENSGPTVQGFQNRAGTFQVQSTKKRTFTKPLRSKDVENQLQNVLDEASSDPNDDYFLDAYRSLTAEEKRAFEEAIGSDLEAFMAWVDQAVAMTETNPELITQLGNPRAIARAMMKSMGNTFRPVKSGTVRGFLDNLNFNTSAYEFGERQIFNTLKGRLLETVGDVEVHVLSYEDMLAFEITAMLDEFERTGQVVPPANGLYDPNSNVVLLREDQMMDRRRAARLLMHEGTHVAFMRAIENDPKVKAALERILAHVRTVINDRLPEYNDMYGLTNIHEMVAEAFANNEFQTFMTAVELTDQMADDIGLPRWVSGVKTAWRALVNTVREALGMPSGTYTALDGIIRLTDAIEGRAALMRATGQLSANPVFGGGNLTIARHRGTAALSALGDRSGAVSSTLKDWGVKFATLDQLRQNMRGLFTAKDGSDLADKFIASLQRIQPEAAAQRQAGEKLAQKYADWAKKNPKQAAALAEVAEQATMLDVTLVGKNDHLKATDHQAREGLKRLQADFAKLSPEAKALYAEMAAHYRNTQNGLTRQTIMNWLDLEPHLTQAQKDDLTNRTMAGKLTDADKKLINNELFKALKQARGMRAIKGDYFPLSRHGEHVVVTQDRLGNLHGGKLVSGTNNVVEFRAANEADADAKSAQFEKSTDLVINSKAKTYYLKGTNTRVTSEQALKTLPAGVKAVDEVIYIDMVTNKRISAAEARQPGVVEGVDFRKGTRRTYRDAAGNSITKAEVLARNVDVAYRVTVQRDGFHTFDSKTDAARFIRENKAQFENISHDPMLRQDVGLHNDLQATQLSGLLSSIQNRQDIDATTKGLAAATVKEAAIRMMAGNRIQKHGLKRQNVAGASRDVARNLVRYTSAAASALARAKHMPAAREAFLAMRQHIKDNRFDKDNTSRSRFFNEVERRWQQGQIATDETSAFGQTIMQLSFLDKLFSPAYSIVNSLQPWMVTYPYLAGKFGAGRATIELSKAYVAIGAHSSWGQGLANTARAARHAAKIGIDTSDVLGSIRKRLAGQPEMKGLFDLLIERGAISNDAGMELSTQLGNGSGTVGHALGRVDRIARQLPSAIEAINRSATAVAAYKLARAQGMSVAEAQSYAFDAVQNTQGDYSDVNAPRWMKYKPLRWAMQFKKYAQMVTYLMFDMARKLGDKTTRKEALKGLATLMAVQVAMAGTLSLPGLEIIKAAAMFAGLFGFGGGWDDIEEELRKVAANSMGKTWEELLNRGVLTRALQIDLSSRVSLSDVWLFGEPKSNTRDNTAAYLFNMVSGAPGSLVLDWQEAVTQAGKGEFGKALEKAIPIKAVADTVKAVNKGEGVGTTLVNAAGFRTAAQAESSAETSARVRKTQAGEAHAKELYRQYRDAKTPAERIKLKSKIRDWNKTAPLRQKVFTNSIDKQRRGQSDD